MNPLRAHALELRLLDQAAERDHRAITRRINHYFDEGATAMAWPIGAFLG